MAIAMAKAACPVKLSPYIFCNRLGKCCFNEITGRAGGWDSMWRGFATRLLEETKVEEKFTEHDLRAKCASDASSLEYARSLLAHADSRLTDRVYRRKPEFVNPLR
jgi:integrase